MANDQANGGGAERTPNNRPFASRPRTDTEEAEYNPSQASRSAAQSVDDYFPDPTNTSQEESAQAVAGAGAMFPTVGSTESAAAPSHVPRRVNSAENSGVATAQIDRTMQAPRAEDRAPKRRGSDLDNARKMQRFRPHVSNGENSQRNTAALGHIDTAGQARPFPIFEREREVLDSPTSLSEHESTPQSSAYGGNEVQEDAEGRSSDSGQHDTGDEPGSSTPTL